MKPNCSWQALKSSRSWIETPHRNAVDAAPLGDLQATTEVVHRSKQFPCRGWLGKHPD